MKLITSLLLGMAVVIAAACGGDDDDDATETPPESPATEEPTPPATETEPPVQETTNPEAMDTEEEPSRLGVDRPTSTLIAEGSTSSPRRTGRLKHWPTRRPWATVALAWTGRR